MIKAIGLYSLSFAVLTLFATPTIGHAKSSSAKDPKRWMAPAEAKRLKNPLPASKANIQLGEKLFLQQCATCHGNSGRGDGPAGMYLGKRPTNFHSETVQQQSDGELYWKIAHGNPPMPAFELILTEKQRWQLVHFLRTFKSK